MPPASIDKPQYTKPQDLNKHTPVYFRFPIEETMKRALLADAGPDPAATAVPEGEFGEAEPNEGEEEEPREEDAHVAEVD